MGDETVTTTLRQDTAPTLRPQQGLLHCRRGCPLRWIVGGLWLFWGLTGVSAQPDRHWESATQAGAQAFNEGHYSEAALQFQVALATAEETSPDALRLSTTLMNLASVYYKQGQYAEAAPLYIRALGLQEHALGTEHPQLADVLYAAAAVERKLHPVRSRLPWSTANHLAARARRLQEREAQAAEAEAPGLWFSQSQEFFGREP